MPRFSSAWREPSSGSFSHFTELFCLRLRLLRCLNRSSATVGSSIAGRSNVPIRAVVYTSGAVADIAASRLGQTGGRLCGIVDDAARFNRDAGVTGVLLFDGE